MVIRKSWWDPPHCPIKVSCYGSRTNVSHDRARSTPIATNLDNDPFPELVRETSDTSVAAYNHDGSEIWETNTQFMFSSSHTTGSRRYR